MWKLYFWSLTDSQSDLWLSISAVFKKIFLFIFRDRGRKGEREGEKHFDWHLYLSLQAASFLFVVILSLQCEPRVALGSGLLNFFIQFLLPTLPCSCVGQISAIWSIQWSIKALCPTLLSQQVFTTRLLTSPPTLTVGQLWVLSIPRTSEFV